MDDEQQAHAPPGYPPRASRSRPPSSQHHRLTLLRRFLTGEQIALRTCVAASLVLLYAQPVSRLVRLTTSDVTGGDGQVSLHLGSPPTPVPSPLDTMLLELAANRANMNTAANPYCDWLFPGGRAGQPLTAGVLLRQLHAFGVPVTQTLTAAFRQLVLQAPAPVVAKALGYHHGTAAKHVTAGGGTWSRYPATRASHELPGRASSPPRTLAQTEAGRWPRRMARISASWSTARNHSAWRGGAGDDTPMRARLPASSTACIVVCW
jgi:hypothetical protein